MSAIFLQMKGGCHLTAIGIQASHLQRMYWNPALKLNVWTAYPHLTWTGINMYLTSRVSNSLFQRDLRLDFIAILAPRLFITTCFASMLCNVLQCSTSPSWSKFFSLQYGQGKVKRLGKFLVGGRKRGYLSL